MPLVPSIYKSWFEVAKKPQPALSMVFDVLQQDELNYKTVPTVFIDVLDILVKTDPQMLHLIQVAKRVVNDGKISG